MTINMKMGEHQVDENSAYWGDVGKLLHEKDQKLKELHLQFKMEQDEKKALKRLNQDVKLFYKIFNSNLFTSKKNIEI
jgi:benzoyl-CoA reductase/2-hydroxyglutaryl-CoA dehydratase subunit BcrC/BadD/HgdB